MDLKKVISGLSAFAVAAGAFAGMAVTASAAGTTELTSTKSAYAEVWQGTTTLHDGAGMDALSVIRTQFRDWGSSDGSVKFTEYKDDQTESGKIALYQFDISKLTGNVTDATLTVTAVGTGYVQKIRLLGYNGDLTIFSNNGGDIAGTVTAGGSFQPLGTNTEYAVTASTDLPQTMVADATAYVDSAVKADRDTVNFAVTANYTRRLEVKTTATLSVTTADTQTYTVTYDVNGTETQETVAEGQSPKMVPSVANYTSTGDKAEYAFNGWSDGNGTYTTEQLGEYKVTGNTTFTAQFDKMDWEEDSIYQNTVQTINVSNTRSESFDIGAAVGDKYVLSADINMERIGDKTSHCSVAFMNESGHIIAGLFYYAADLGSNKNSYDPNIYFVTSGDPTSSENGLSPDSIGADNYVRLVESAEGSNPGEINAVFIVDETNNTVTMEYDGEKHVLPLNNKAETVKSIAYGGYRYNAGTIANIFVKEYSEPVIPATVSDVSKAVETFTEGDGTWAKAYTFSVTPGTNTVTKVTVSVNKKQVAKDTQITSGEAVFGIIISSDSEDKLNSIETPDVTIE